MHKLGLYSFFLLLFLLQACNSLSPWERGYDHSRNFTYPSQCLHDLSEETKDIPVLYVPKEEIEGNDGVTYLFPIFLIKINNNLQGWRQEEVLHHERCHIVAGFWHP